MLPRKLTLDLILCRLQLPVELRSIICETYFPFLPNAMQKLTPAILLRFTDRKNTNAAAVIKLHYVRYEKHSSPHKYFTMEMLKTSKQLVIRIVLGNLVSYPNQYCYISTIYWLDDVDANHDTGFYSLRINLDDITEINVLEKTNYILKWYYERLLHAVDYVWPRFEF